MTFNSVLQSVDDWISSGQNPVRLRAFAEELRAYSFRAEQRADEIEKWTLRRERRERQDEATH